MLMILESLQDVCSRTEGNCGHTEDTRLALDIISIVGVILSGVGLILTIVTLLVFKYVVDYFFTIFYNFVGFLFAGNFENEMPQSSTYS